MSEAIDGTAVADGIRAGLAEPIERLSDVGHRPGLGTVLVGDDPASETYVSMKQRDCAEVGVESTARHVAGDATSEELYSVIEELNTDPSVDAYLIQWPIPDHLDYHRAMARVDPEKDVEGFHPENAGRLMAGDPRYKPCTPHGIQRLLDVAGVELKGADVTIVGCSDITGKPLANLLMGDWPGGNATVTVCQEHTKNLEEKTRGADVVVVAAGVPELVDGSMLSEGAVVIDVGYNRVDTDTEKGYELLGDVDYESAKEKASAITPVPGGVGPMTRAMLLYNTVLAASRRAGIDVELP